MWNVIKIELKRAIINKKFVIVILLGCIMAVLAFVDTPGFTIAINWYKYMHNDEMASMIINKMNEVDTPLEIWMPRYGASSTFYNVWIAILPILVVIPYATEYLKEKKSGLINQFMVRMTKKNSNIYISRTCSSYTISVQSYGSYVLSSMGNAYPCYGIISSSYRECF